MDDIYLVNESKKECINLTDLSNDMNVHKRILDVFRSPPIPNRMFDNSDVKDLVLLIVGRWSRDDDCSIKFYDVSERDCFMNCTDVFLQAMLTVSMLNYGITFTEEDSWQRMEEWYKHMNTEKNKRKAQNIDTFQLSCSMDDIWKTSYGMYHQGTKDLCIQLCRKFIKKESKDETMVMCPKIPFTKVMMSDEFVGFFNDIEVNPAQMIYYENKLLFKELRVWFNTGFEQKYELPDGVTTVDSTISDLTHPYFQKEIYFKKDIVLKHAADLDNRFSLLQVKGEKLKLQNIIQLISEFGNSGRYDHHIYKEPFQVEVEDHKDEDFNMYESVCEDGKKQYDIFDKEGVSKKPINVNVWVVAMDRIYAEYCN